MDEFKDIVGPSQVLTEPADMARYLTDWTGAWTGTARAVVRPGTTEEVAQVVRAAAGLALPITVQSGNTSICGGSVPAKGDEGILISLDRMTRIRAIDTGARTATVDAGVILQTLQECVAEDDLDFPLVFGARGSARIGGCLATNAGGANALRYGNARELCLGIEAVLPDGQIIDALSGLRKDNTGYDLKDLLIGSEGTLAIITGAVLKLVPTPRVRATAFLALAGIEAALPVLNRLQDDTGGLVEAFEWMPGATVEAILAHNPGMRAPLERPADHGILVELASTRPSDALAGEDGEVPLQTLLLSSIETMMQQELVIDGYFATTEQQRIDLWSLRESVLETIVSHGDFLTLDASLPLSRIPEFLARAAPLTEQAGLKPLLIAHLGDGNVHYAVVAGASPLEAERARSFTDRMIALLNDFGGSFSAEHGIGRAKVRLLAQEKQAAQYQMMQAIRKAIDPAGHLSPGLLLDPAT